MVALVLRKRSPFALHAGFGGSAPAGICGPVLFTVNYWLGRNPRRWLSIAVLDVNAAAGLGEVVLTNQPVVPDTLLQRLGHHDFMEQAALVRHPDGRSW